MFRSVLSFSMGFILTESVTDLEIMSKFMYKHVAQLGTLEFIKNFMIVNKIIGIGF